MIIQTIKDIESERKRVWLHPFLMPLLFYFKVFFEIIRWWYSHNEGWEEVGEHHYELCKKLHGLMDRLPPKIKEEIWDDVYQHFEP